MSTEADAGWFRRDLYYRLNTVELTIPPLRERREDIPFLVASFIRDTSKRLKKPITGLTPSAERVLFNAAWNGNVRELRNLVERACIMADGEFISVEDVKHVSIRVSSPEPSAMDVDSSSGFDLGGNLKSHRLSMVEREHILRVLRSANGNKAQAARVLGVSRRALYRWLDRLAIGEKVPAASTSESL